ncbi:uncharacterized protein LACBIDRAFT_298253 [Laccaria bicolor S238N-H82]|uniref:Predicted protein n=1 Tax=Laccaria bicolor (strain S238N-H82 / ATCC MYA-4686) TaxID=486041 RepID=B0DCK4_LACBS|nr:uncharacterized protein LACBIDRAFT_298253 [Laccaria bicolor S238N-H82]EDR07746.1 predicted protein [Laccaria bicolor S238N-H82]|eukprot:XP_001881535.1 predicted protein [Laccaria bicolor S238N-H82]
MTRNYSPTHIVIQTAQNRQLTPILRSMHRNRHRRCHPPAPSAFRPKAYNGRNPPCSVNRNEHNPLLVLIHKHTSIWIKHPRACGEEGLGW